MGESTGGLEQTLVTRVVAEPRLDPELLELEDSDQRRCQGQCRVITNGAAVSTESISHGQWGYRAWAHGEGHVGSSDGPVWACTSGPNQYLVTLMSPYTYRASTEATVTWNHVHTTFLLVNVSTCQSSVIVLRRQQSSLCCCSLRAKHGVVQRDVRGWYYTTCKTPGACCKNWLTQTDPQRFC